MEQGIKDDHTHACTNPYTPHLNHPHNLYIPYKSVKSTHWQCIHNLKQHKPDPGLNATKHFIG